MDKQLNRKDEAVMHVLQAWELPEKGQDASQTIWKRVLKILKEKPQEHDFWTIKWNMVKYYGQNASRRPCILCKAQGASQFCVQCYYIGATGMLTVCCKKCQARHRDNVSPDDKDFNHSRYDTHDSCDISDEEDE